MDRALDAGPVGLDHGIGTVFGAQIGAPAVEPLEQVLDVGDGNDILLRPIF